MFGTSTVRRGLLRNKMRVAIIGANGQLGTDLVRVFNDEDIIALNHQDIEITELSRSKKVIEDARPDIIVNTAGYHNVPECEKNPQIAFLVNATGVRNLAQICRANSIKLVHISTDYVFDGKKGNPYIEEDTPNPLNVYGVSKLAGEYFVQRVKVHYIIRTAKFFGVTGCRAKSGENFVKTMLNLAKTKDIIQVASNIICSPTYTMDAAVRIKEIIKNGYDPGIYHVINSGFCSLHEFALEIFRQTGVKIKVEKKEEKEEVEEVLRPLYSALASNRLPPMRHWKEALSAYLEQIG